MAKFQFDATQVAPSQALDPIPAGWYIGHIVESELTENRNKDGAYINFQIEVLDGPYKGRKVFGRMNVYNKNPQAQEIAYRELSALCHATGVLRVEDTQQLHGRPFEVKVSVRKDEGYEPSNDVKGFRPVGAGAAQGGAPAQGQPYGQPQAPQHGAAPPWQGGAPAQGQPGGYAPQQAAPQGAPVAQVPSAPAAPGAVPPWQR